MQIDKEKLLEWLNVEIDLSHGNDPVLKADRWAFRLVKKEVESGRLDAAPADNSEQGCKNQKGLLG